MTVRGRVSAVVVLLLVAGCTAPTAPTAPSPPGLTGEEVTDANALVRAHTDALGARPFAVRRTTTVRGVEREFRATTTRTWRVDPTGPVRGSAVRTVNVSGDAPERYARAPAEVAAWRNGTTAVRRVRADGDVRYRRVDPFDSSVKLNPALHRQTLYRLTTRSGATVERVSRDGSQFYRISAALNDTHVATNVSMTLLVDGAGIVREIRTAQTVRYRSGQRRITERIRFHDVGTTSVDRPGWVRHAIEETGRDRDG